MRSRLRRNGCFLKWWYPQNSPKWSFLVGHHHFRKPPNDRFFLVGKHTWRPHYLSRSFHRKNRLQKSGRLGILNPWMFFLETYFGISFYAMYSITFPLKTVTNKLLSCSSFLSINFRLRFSRSTISSLFKRQIPQFLVLNFLPNFQVVIDSCKTELYLPPPPPTLAAMVAFEWRLRHRDSLRIMSSWCLDEANILGGGFRSKLFGWIDGVSIERWKTTLFFFKVVYGGEKLPFCYRV